MELDEWLFRNKMTITSLAKSLDINRVHLNAIVNKKLIAGKRLAKDIEIATHGQVTMAELLAGKKERKKRMA